MKKHKGEIATLLTLGLVILGGVLAIGSSVFLSQQKTTSTRAAGCGSIGGNYSCNHPDVNKALCPDQYLEFACCVKDNYSCGGGVRYRWYGCGGQPCENTKISNSYGQLYGCPKAWTNTWTDIEKDKNNSNYICEKDLTLTPAPAISPGPCINYVSNDQCNKICHASRERADWICSSNLCCPSTNIPTPISTTPGGPIDTPIPGPTTPFVCDPNSTNLPGCITPTPLPTTCGHQGEPICSTSPKCVSGLTPWSDPSGKRICTENCEPFHGICWQDILASTSQLPYICSGVNKCVAAGEYAVRVGECEVVYNCDPNVGGLGSSKVSCLSEVVSGVNRNSNSTIVSCSQCTWYPFSTDMCCWNCKKI